MDSVARRNFSAFRMAKMIAERPPDQRTITQISLRLARRSWVPKLSSLVPQLVPWHLKPFQPCAAWKPAPQSKRPAAKTPHAPQAPCTAKASMGSSIFAAFRAAEASWKIKAPRTPMRIDVPVSTLPQPAVMETRPARMPLQRPPMSYRRNIAYRRPKTTRPPTDAASVVFMATWAAIKPFSMVCIANVEPQLKPYQPNQRMKVPRMMRGWLCGSKASGHSVMRSFAVVPTGKRPMRGPAMAEPTSAAIPPVRWTTPLPAKSM
mmetsp:Transcript_20463/g.64336  ORF Transcript_20463/g.64336 Transcript_20463/m.64336 type:complete len:263 (+) Transcript_20463:176-964(+)